MPSAMSNGSVPSFETIKKMALDRVGAIHNQKNHTCPLCASPVDYKARFTIPEGFTIYGRSIQEIAHIIDYAQEHGYKFYLQDKNK